MNSTDDLPIRGFGWAEGEARAYEKLPVFVNSTDPERKRVGTTERCKQHTPNGNWVCTRPPGHLGMHMAGHHDLLVAAW